MGIRDLFVKKKISKEEMNHVQKLLKKCNDCARIESTTMDIGEFYARYDEFENNLTDLIAYEKYRIFSNMLPSANLKYIRENRVNDENALIRRTYQAVKAQAEAAGSVEEKNRLYEDYFSSFDEYRGKMDTFNIEQLEELKKMSIKAED